MSGRADALPALLLCLTLCVSPAAAEAQGARDMVRADGIAALIGGSAPGKGVRMILRSDVDLRARLALAGQQPNGPLPLGQLPPDLLAASLEELIGEALIANEAARIGLGAPSRKALQSERARLAVSCGGAARFNALARALGVTSPEIDRWVRKRAVVAVFLEANLEGETDFTSAELERAYDEGNHPFIGRPLDEVREALGFWLGREAMRRAVERWVTGLRGRTIVKVLASY